MFDFKFDWDSSMNIGIEMIDLQHQELFKIARRIEQLVITKCIGVKKEELINIVCDLREFVAYHFYEEEKIMKEMNYSQFMEHSSLHENYRSQLILFDCNKLIKQPFQYLNLLKGGLTDCIFDHVLKEDVKIAVERKEKERIIKLFDSKLEERKKDDSLLHDDL